MVCTVSEMLLSREPHFQELIRNFSFFSVFFLFISLYTTKMVIFFFILKLKVLLFGAVMK